MDYKARKQALGSEYNALAAQLQQPLNRLSFLQGQIEIVMALEEEEEAAKKAIVDAAKKLSEDEAVKANSKAVDTPPVEWVPNTQTGSPE